MADRDRSATTMNVSLPRVLRDFVEERVTESSYGSASEYVRELIRKDRERRAAAGRLEALLLDGLASGPAEEWTDADWSALRARVSRRLRDADRDGA